MSSMKRIRAAFCGDIGVGKSSIIAKFSKSDSKTTPTVGGFFQPLYVKTRNEMVNLEVWDTSGSERYRSLIPSFLRSASVIVVVFDVTSRESYDNLEGWLETAMNYAPQDASFIIVGNKTDKYEDRVISTNEFNQKWSNKGSMGLIETSAVTGESIDNLFSLLCSAQATAYEAPETVDSVIELRSSKCC